MAARLAKLEAEAEARRRKDEEEAEARRRRRVEGLEALQTHVDSLAESHARILAQQFGEPPFLFP
jgi:hypothetical protein